MSGQAADTTTTAIAHFPKQGSGLFGAGRDDPLVVQGCAAARPDSANCEQGIKSSPLSISETQAGSLYHFWEFS